MKLKFFQNIIDVLSRKKKLNIKEFFNLKPQIPFVVFWVGTKCTLKCKLCCNLIPYTEQKSYNADEIIKDLKALCDNADIKTLQLQGGEPFLHPEIYKIISSVSKMPVGKIELCTNATVKINEATIKALQEATNIDLRISNYTCTDKLRENFINQLDENGIKYRIYDFVFGNGTWFSTGGINETKSDDKSAQSIYEKCEYKTFHTLANGILTVCGKVPSIKEVYRFNESKINDEINIRKLRHYNVLSGFLINLSIRLFLKNLKKYKQQCRYCRISSEKFPAAEQLNSEKSKLLVYSK